MYLFRQAINHIHYLLAYFICRFHGCSLRINTDNRFSITLTQMYPLVWEIDFHTVYVVYLFILIQFLYLAKIASTSVSGVRSMRFLAMK